jgi:phospholipase C
VHVASSTTIIEECTLTRKRSLGLLLALCALAGASLITAVTSASGRSGRARQHNRYTAAGGTYTPIKHVVVIFQENVSFDHYFGTYPSATNTDGQTFHAASGTPAVDGLPPATASSLPANLRHSTNLLTTNPNEGLPVRLDSSAAGTVSGQGELTCDQDHDYSDEQKAFDKGKMDLFVQSVGTGTGTGPVGNKCDAKQVMDYYDGNTVTGLWNYAQHYAMSDNSYGTTFGPSAPGAINLVSGDTGAVDTSHTANIPSLSTRAAPDGDLDADGKGGYSLTSDAQPYWDDCSTRDAVAMSGTNIGDELNQQNLSWGWFEGGFRPSTSYANALAATGQTGQSTSTFIADEFKNAGFQSHVPNSSNQGLCDTVHPVGVALGGTGQYGYKDDYIPHHEPFQYYASTANPHHLTIPTSSGKDTLAGLKEIGHDSQSYVNGVPQFNTPNHQYDTSDFNQLVAAITAGQLPASSLPAVSFLKAPGYQDGHAGYSDPRDEQKFVVSVINSLENSPDWGSTAVIVNYDDSDGWYDHVYSGITNPSSSPGDNLTGTTTTGNTSGECSSNPSSAHPLAGEQGRCGFGPRLPMMVISPWSKSNAVDHNLSDQASIINFVEYNWGLPGIPGSADQVLAERDAGAGNPFDLAGLFDFSSPHGPKLILNSSTGQPG